MNISLSILMLIAAMSLYAADSASAAHLTVDDRNAAERDRSTVSIKIVATLLHSPTINGADEAWTLAADREIAAEMAGMYRLEEAIDPLLLRISEPGVRPMLLRGAPNAPYYYALLRIGSPASERAIARLTGEENEQTCELLAMLLHGIDGSAIAAVRVERALADTTEKPAIQKTLKSIQIKLKAMKQ